MSATITPIATVPHIPDPPPSIPAAALPAKKAPLLEVVVGRDLLLAEIAVAHGIAATSKLMPALQHLLLETGNGILSITATNMEQTLRTRAPPQSGGRGRLPYRRVVCLAKMMQEGGVEVDPVTIMCWVHRYASSEKGKIYK